MKFPSGRTEISHQQEHKITVTLTFALQAPDSNQFIFESEWLFVTYLKNFFFFLWGQRDLDLWLPTSYQSNLESKWMFKELFFVRNSLKAFSRYRVHMNGTDNTKNMCRGIENID